MRVPRVQSRITGRPVHLSTLFLLTRKGRYGLIDYPKVFCPDPADDVLDARGVDPSGCVIVPVRPARRDDPALGRP